MSTLDALIQRHADARPDALALVDAIGSDDAWSASDPASGIRLTWAELADAVDRVAGVLLGHGLRDHEVVTTLLPVGADALITQLAVIRISAELVSRDPDSPGAGVEEPAAALITTTHVLDRMMSRGSARLRADVPSLRLVLVWGPAPRDGALWLDPEVASGRDRDLVSRHRQGHAARPDTVLGPAAAGATHAQVLATAAAASRTHDLRWDDVVLDADPTRAAVLDRTGPAWLFSGCTLVLARALRAPALWQFAAVSEASVVVAPATAMVPVPSGPLLSVRAVIATAAGALDDLAHWGGDNRTTVARWGEPGGQAGLAG